MPDATPATNFGKGYARGEADERARTRKLLLTLYSPGVPKISNNLGSVSRRGANAAVGQALVNLRLMTKEEVEEAFAGLEAEYEEKAERDLAQMRLDAEEAR